MIGAALIGIALGATGKPGYLCNYAKITGSARSITVRSWHDPRSKRITQLAPGTAVYICDEYRNDDLSNRWVQVSFSDVRHSCPGSTNGLPVRRITSCRTGWVKERNVETLSG